MYCANCAKHMPDQAEFCPCCGAANPNAAKNASACGRPLASSKAAKLSIFRAVLIILGALHVLAFFGLSYAELSGMGLMLSYALPQDLTAIGYITFSLDAAGRGLIDGGSTVLNVVSCMLLIYLPLKLCLVRRGLITLLSAYRRL